MISTFFLKFRPSNFFLLFISFYVIILIITFSRLILRHNTLCQDYAENKIEFETMKSALKSSVALFCRLWIISELFDYYLYLEFVDVTMYFCRCSHSDCATRRSVEFMINRSSTKQPHHSRMCDNGWIWLHSKVLNQHLDLDEAKNFMKLTNLWTKPELTPIFSQFCFL